MKTPETYYGLPPELGEDIEAYAGDVQRFLNGELAPALLKAKRVPRGVYEQRQDGTYMVRVRIACGAVSAEQARQLALVADEFGNGQLHATTRQDLQIHNVDIADTPTVMRRLRQVGLTSKGGGGNTVRNVAACPYAGVCPSEQFDVTGFGHAVTEYLIRLVGSYNLPRKYKIAFSGCAADCALARFSDLGFVARARDGVAGFSLYAGGGMGSHSRVADLLEDWVPGTEVIRIAEAVRRLFDRMGDRQNRRRARLRFVLERIGAQRFREAFREQIAQLREEGVPECGIVVQPAESPEGADGAPERWQRRTERGLRLLTQSRPNRVTALLHLPMGFVSSQDFLRLAELSAEFSAEGGLRTARSQDLLMRSIDVGAVPLLEEQLGALETDVVSATPLERFVACAGASTCRLGLCLSRNAARACAQAFEDAGIEPDGLDSPGVNISGCSNACGHHPAAAVGLFGSALRYGDRLLPAYKVVLGARVEETGPRLGQALGIVPGRALPAFLVDLVRDYESGREGDETFAAYFSRKGTEHFEGLVGRRATPPDYADDPTFYRDWGQEEDFSLAGRGAGECGAGVFEVISEDIKLARKSLAGVEDGPDLFAAFLPTIRALLITRGVDAQDAGRVIRSFDEHFVETGMVASSYRSLLDRARGHLQGWREAFAGQRASVEGLLDRVELLFSTLDAGLTFHPPEDSAPEPKPSAAASEPGGLPGEQTDGASQELDLRGVACPMNFVKTKLKLEAMAVGETLDVLLDDGEPVRSVPASLKGEGQDVVEAVALDASHWRVRVKKRN